MFSPLQKTIFLPELFVLPDPDIFVAVLQKHLENVVAVLGQSKFFQKILGNVFNICLRFGWKPVYGVQSYELVLVPHPGFEAGLKSGELGLFQNGLQQTKKY